MACTTYGFQLHFLVHNKKNKINMSLHVCRKAVKLQIIHTKISIKKTKEIGKELFSKILKDVQVTNLEYLLASVKLTNM